MHWGITTFRWLVTLLLIGGSGFAIARHLEDDGIAGRYGQVQVLRPAGVPRAMVVLFPDGDGSGQEPRRLARGLAGGGALVAIVDTPHYLQRLQGGAEADCGLLADDAERLGKKLMRQQHVDVFLPPLLVGEGRGALLARQALAAAAPEVLAGAVVAGAPPARGASVAGACRAGPPSPAQGALVAVPAATGSAGLVAAARARFPAPGGSGLAGLPLVELHAPGSDRLAILISGDGGWRELDKGIAADLQRRGVSVVGWNSLRYFWSEKSPQQVGSDLARVMAEYRRRWHADRVALVGYSFGADVMPFAYAQLPPAQRDAVQSISLLGLAHGADFKVRVGGWLGLGTSSERPVLPALVRLDPHRVQCIYGQQEKDTLCPELRARGVAVVMRPGGHHFDHDPSALTDAIEQGWQRAVAPDAGAGVARAQAPGAGATLGAMP